MPRPDLLAGSNSRTASRPSTCCPCRPPADRCACRDRLARFDRFATSRSPRSPTARCRRRCCLRGTSIIQVVVRLMRNV
jgi:hypothetical protein